MKIISARKIHLAALLIFVSVAALVVANISSVTYHYQIATNQSIVANGVVSTTLFGNRVVSSSPFDTQFSPNELTSDNKIKNHRLISKGTFLHGATVDKTFQAPLEVPTQFTISAKNGSDYMVTVTVRSRTGLSAII